MNMADLLDQERQYNPLIGIRLIDNGLVMQYMDPDTLTDRMKHFSKAGEATEFLDALLLRVQSKQSPNSDAN